MTVRKGPMVASVSRSIKAVTFQDEQRWGIQLMLSYALQIDRAEAVKKEILDTIEELEQSGGTASQKWFQRLERIEKYMTAESTLSTMGPKLLDIMMKFGMTPAVAAPRGRGKSGATNVPAVAAPIDEVEDELAALRAERGRTA
jgi:hypothetical protein